MEFLMKTIIIASWTRWQVRGKRAWLSRSWWLSGKETACQCRRCRKHGFNLWVGTIPWRKSWQPTLVFLPGESHGQRSLVVYKVHGVAKSQTNKPLSMHPWAIIPMVIYSPSTFSFSFLFFLTRLMGSQFPDQGWTQAQQWKHRVLTTRQPGTPCLGLLKGRSELRIGHCWAGIQPENHSVPWERTRGVRLLLKSCSSRNNK